MGMFVNSGNLAFQAAVSSEIYIDKTGLLNYTNKVLDTLQNCICNSRPRRFGKSVTAAMLTAYYSRGCHSDELFSGLEIFWITIPYITHGQLSVSCFEKDFKATGQKLRPTKQFCPSSV